MWAPQTALLWALQAHTTGTTDVAAVGTVGLNRAAGPYETQCLYSLLLLVTAEMLHADVRQLLKSGASFKEQDLNRAREECYNRVVCHFAPQNNRSDSRKYRQDLRVRIAAVISQIQSMQ
eukprot:3536073-Rhodomonas_salina.1